ncbi:hypothetical protein [Streptomyces sp. SID9124]|uniref:hypothetical protein n=1 Tax=Streptomyces sp. SID9124 TaxID=2706108 RepID=UPI0013DF0668|nr:hypothetical protein [Streptomyces sp. SID9124]NED12701.1 hypothetical protein [Streptomyces sp. SID9124]
MNTDVEANEDTDSAKAADEKPEPAREAAKEPAREPAREAAKEPTPELPGQPDGTGNGARRDRRWPRVLAAVLAVALLAAGAVMHAAGRQLRDTPATSNRALTDSAATAQVAGEVTNALGKVFSYSPDGTAATKASAQKLLAGKALQQYAALFGQVEKQSADQKLTLTTHVVRAGVTRLTPDSAHLLVFLDQVYERKGRAASKAAAQLSVTARLREGHWTIVEITSR